MLTLYSFVAIFVTAVFFSVYVYIIKRYNYGNWHIGNALIRCLLSLIISIAVPVVYSKYVLNNPLKVKPLLFLLTLLLATGAYLIVRRKEGEIFFMMKEFFTKLASPLIKTTKLISKRDAKIIDLSNQNNSSDDFSYGYNEFEDMGAFKFIISNEQKNTLGAISDSAEVPKKDSADSEVLKDNNSKKMHEVDVDDILQEVEEHRKEEIDSIVEEIQKEVQQELEQKPIEREQDEECVDEKDDTEQLHSVDNHIEAPSEQNFVDSNENIDKMGLENYTPQDLQHECELEISANMDSMPDIENLSIDECIDMAFLHKQKGEPELAVLYYMNVIDKHLPKDLALMVLLDICALYKEMGNPEVAKNVLEGYLAKFSEMLDTEEKTEIEKNLR